VVVGFQAASVRFSRSRGLHCATLKLSHRRVSAIPSVADRASSYSDLDVNSRSHRILSPQRDALAAPFSCTTLLRWDDGVSRDLLFWQASEALLWMMGCLEICFLGRRQRRCFGSLVPHAACRRRSCSGRQVRGAASRGCAPAIPQRQHQERRARNKSNDRG
jgi:hypothetical protein